MHNNRLTALPESIGNLRHLEPFGGKFLGATFRQEIGNPGKQPKSGWRLTTGKNPSGIEFSGQNQIELARFIRLDHGNVEKRKRFKMKHSSHGIVLESAWVNSFKSTHLISLSRRGKTMESLMAACSLIFAGWCNLFLARFWELLRESCTEGTGFLEVGEQISEAGNTTGWLIDVGDKIL